jgi:hypothetical protein
VATVHPGNLHNILIDHFNDIAEASTFIAGVDPGKTAISVITYAADFRELFQKLKDTIAVPAAWQGTG